MYLFSVIGLTFDIFGVLLLFYFGLPSKIINKSKKIFIGKVKGEQKKYVNRHNLFINIGAYTGLTFMLIGFILQLIGVLSNRV